MKTQLRNRHVSALLYNWLRDRRRSQSYLAERAGMHRSVVSEQLEGRRPINANHLGGYMRALPGMRRQLVYAWLKDRLGPELAREAMPDRPDGTNLLLLPFLPLKKMFAVTAAAAVAIFGPAQRDVDVPGTQREASIQIGSCEGQYGSPVNCHQWAGIDLDYNDWDDRGV